MKRQKWFLVGLMLVLVFSWASLAQAYYNGELINCEVNIWTPYEFIDGNTQLVTFSGGGTRTEINFTPTTSGFFSQQQAFTFGVGVSYMPSFDWHWSGEYSRTYGPIDAYFGYDIILDVDQPLLVTDLSFNVKMVGYETPIYAMSADTDFINSHTTQEWVFWYGGNQFNLGSIPAEIGPDGFGGGGAEFTFIASLSGHVAFSTPSIEQIISFLDNAVANGTLTGEGLGKSADGRLKALRRMIETARELIAAGKLEEAYQQLNDAYNRTDSDFLIPDFVDGVAADELAQMILALENSLDQTTSPALSTSDTFHTPLPPTVWLLGSGLLGLVGWRKIRKG